MIKSIFTCSDHPMHPNGTWPRGLQLRPLGSGREVREVPAMVPQGTDGSMGGSSQVVFDSGAIHIIL